MSNEQPRAALEKAAKEYLSDNNQKAVFITANGDCFAYNGGGLSSLMAAIKTDKLASYSAALVNDEVVMLEHTEAFLKQLTSTHGRDMMNNIANGLPPNGITEQDAQLIDNAQQINTVLEKEKERLEVELAELRTRKEQANRELSERDELAEEIKQLTKDREELRESIEQLTKTKDELQHTIDALNKTKKAKQ